MSLLKDRMEAGGFKSKDALAVEVLRLWQKQEKGPKPQQRSLGAKIGELERGQVVWWRNHPKAAEALAEVLEIELDDLLPPLATQEERFFRFEDFPQLQPFDPRREAFCDILIVNDRVGEDSPFRWFDDPRGQFFTWLEVPPGMGRRFLAYWHRQRGVKTYEANTLSLVQLNPGNDPVIVLINSPDPEHDEDWLFQHRQRRNLLILAPFPFPVTEPEVSFNSWMAGSWSSRTIESTARRKLVLWNPLNNLYKSRVELVRDWRTQFVNWVAKRIPKDTLFSPEPFLDWLKRFDPEERLLATPADVLPFCEYAHKFGEKKLDSTHRKDFAEHWVQQMVERANDGSPRALWLKYQGIKTLREAVLKRWRDISMRWQGGLSRAQWVELLPSSHLPKRSDELQRALQEIASISNKRERERRAQEAASQIKEAPEIALDYLREAGLVRVGSLGQLSLNPAWVANFWVQEEVRRSVFEEPPGLWGRWYVSAERRPLLDATLDSLSSQEFISLIFKNVPDAPSDFSDFMRKLSAKLDKEKQVSPLEEKMELARLASVFSPDARPIEFASDSAPPEDLKDTPSLGEVGALEALFSACARRYEFGWSPSKELTDEKTFQLSICLRAIEHNVRALARLRGRPPVLSSLLRWGITEGQPEGLRWLGDCWVWSLLSKPGEFRPSWGSWVFPGRQEKPLAEIPEWMFAYLKPQEKENRSKERQLKRLMKIAALVLQRLKDNQEIPDKIPPVLLPGVLLFAARCRVFADANHINELQANQIVSEFLFDQIKNRSEAEKRKISICLWGGFSKVKPLSGRYLNLRDILTLVLEHLPENFFVASLDSVEFDSMFGDPFVLPPRLRLAAARWVEQKHPDRLSIFVQNPGEFMKEDIECLLLLAQHLNNQACAWHSRAVLWRLEPQLSLQKTQEALAQEGKIEASWWYWTAPRAQLEVLVEMLEKLPKGSRPGWIPQWLETKIPEGDLITERLFQLWSSLEPKLPVSQPPK